jgi:hypothetical protein
MTVLSWTESAESVTIARRMSQKAMVLVQPSQAGAG